MTRETRIVADVVLGRPDAPALVAAWGEGAVALSQVHARVSYGWVIGASTHDVRRRVARLGFDAAAVTLFESETRERPRAAPSFVDVENLGGIFTLGATRSGWRLAAVRRMDGAFGLPLLRDNARLVTNGGLELPDVQTGHSDWEGVNGVGAVFATPPCSGFSRLTQSLEKSGMHGADAVQNACMREVISFAARCRGLDGKPGPEIVCFESVPKAGTAGRGLMLELRDVLGGSYTLYHVQHTHAFCGGAQKRPRYFFVAARVPFGVGPAEKDEITVGDAIDDLRSLESSADDQPYRAALSGETRGVLLRRADGLVSDHRWDVDRANEAWLTAYDRWRGETNAATMLRESSPEQIAALQTEFDRVGRLSPFRAERKTWFGRPRKLAGDQRCGVITGRGGGDLFHYAEARPLSVREGARLMGLPDEWRYGAASSVQLAYAWIGKSLPLETAEWISTWARRSLEGEPGPWTGDELGERERQIACGLPA